MAKYPRPFSLLVSSPHFISNFILSSFLPYDVLPAPPPVLVPEEWGFISAYICIWSHYRERRRVTQETSEMRRNKTTTKNIKSVERGNVSGGSKEFSLQKLPSTVRNLFFCRSKDVQLGWRIDALNHPGLQRRQIKHTNEQTNRSSCLLCKTTSSPHTHPFTLTGCHDRGRDPHRH